MSCILCRDVGVNKGLREYNQFLESKEVNGFQELREITQKPRLNEPLINLADSKGNPKQLTNKNISILPPNPVPLPNIEKENYEEIDSAMVDE